jgi:hypothetical protein
MKLRWWGSSVLESRSKDLPAVGKVLTERAIKVEALGWIWCPRDGMECKDLGNNHFLFTFSQVSYCKCSQVLIIGFDDNDHTIRGLMRFIKMTSR